MNDKRKTTKTDDIVTIEIEAFHSLEELFADAHREGFTLKSISDSGYLLQATGPVAVLVAWVEGNWGPEHAIDEGYGSTAEWIRSCQNPSVAVGEPPSTEVVLVVRWLDSDIPEGVDLAAWTAQMIWDATAETGRTQPTAIEEG